MDADGQIDGRGIGHKILSGTHGNEDEKNSSQNTMQYPNPLRAMTENYWLSSWKSFLRTTKILRNLKIRRAIISSERRNLCEIFGGRRVHIQK